MVVKKNLITGGAGFIGLSIAKYLSEEIIKFIYLIIYLEGN